MTKVGRITKTPEGKTCRYALPGDLTHVGTPEGEEEEETKRDEMPF
jgi:hypothetical protein